MERAFDPYTDRDLDERVLQARLDWEQRAEDALAEQIDPEHLEALRNEAGGRSIATLELLMSNDQPAHSLARQDFLTQAIFSEERRLLPHQIAQAIFAVERERSLNASETGTGKFLVALAMRRLVEHEAAGRIVKCLYTCPKSALGQFEQEFIDHGYRTFVLRHGNDVIPADTDTVLVANSTMLVTHRDQLRGWRPLLVVLDEAAAFKTATAARTRAVYGDALDGAGGIIDEVPFVLAMSGTLAPAHNGELYPHLRALTPTALIDERGRIMRRHVFEKTFCEFGIRRIAGGREVQVITGSRNSGLLRKRIEPFVAHVTLREIAPTLPPERHELVPIAREDVKLDELTAIAGIEDLEIRAAIEVLVAAIRDDLVPEPDIDREMTRLMQMIGGGTALAHLRRAYGLAKLPYIEDVVMSRRGGNREERTPTLIFNTYRMTGDRLESIARGAGRCGWADPWRHLRRRTNRRGLGNSGRQRRGGNSADRRCRLGAQPAGRQPDHHARTELDTGREPSGGRPRRAHRPAQPGAGFLADSPNTRSMNR